VIVRRCSSWSRSGGGGLRGRAVWSMSSESGGCSFWTSLSRSRSGSCTTSRWSSVNCAGRRSSRPLMATSCRRNGWALGPDRQCRTDRGRFEGDRHSLGARSAGPLASRSSGSRPSSSVRRAPAMGLPSARPDGSTVRRPAGLSSLERVTAAAAAPTAGVMGAFRAGRGLVLVTRGGGEMRYRARAFGPRLGRLWRLG
jgi:hypothetical protein